MLPKRTCMLFFSLYCSCGEPWGGITAPSSPGCNPDGDPGGQVDTRAQHLGLRTQLSEVMLAGLSVPAGYWVSEERLPWEQTPGLCRAPCSPGRGQATRPHPFTGPSPPPACTLYNGTLYNIAKQVVFLKTASEHFFGLNLGMKQMDF